MIIDKPTRSYLMDGKGGKNHGKGWRGVLKWSKDLLMIDGFLVSTVN